jgi:hypothetical protein
VCVSVSRLDVSFVFGRSQHITARNPGCAFTFARVVGMGV